MSYLAPIKRVVRASPILLGRTGAMCTAVDRLRCRRFNDSTKARAVQSPVYPPVNDTVGRQGNLETIFASGKTPATASSDGHLNILENMQRGEFYATVAKVMDIRKKYLEKRYLWIPSEEMISICIGLGAKREDLDKLAVASDRLMTDPLQRFRKVRYGRFCLDYNNQSIRRLQPWPYSLSPDGDSQESSDTRIFDEIENNIAHNTIAQALMLFQAMVIQGVKVNPRPSLDYDCNRTLITMFNIRTTTNHEKLGLPAIEDVHSDGVDHTFTFMLGHQNMRKDSAFTLMHAENEATGTAQRDTRPDRIRGCYQLHTMLDTLMMIDHEYKHSVSPVYQENPSADTIRDVLLLFARQPSKKDLVSGRLDSTKTDDEKVEIPIFTPKWH